MGIAERKLAEKNARVKLILDSAAAVYLSKGFKEATIEDIATQAQISKGTIYLYFKSKADLYMCLTLPALEKHIKRLEKIGADKASAPDEKMRKLAQAVYDYYTKNPESFYLITRYKEAEHSKLLPEERLKTLRQLMRASFKPCERAIKEGIARGIFKETNPYVGAIIFWSSFFGMIQFQENRIGPGKKDYRSATLDYLEVIIDGLRKH